MIVLCYLIASALSAFASGLRLSVGHAAVYGLVGGIIGAVFGAVVDGTSEWLRQHVGGENPGALDWLIGGAYLAITIVGTFYLFRFSWLVMPDIVP